MGVSTGGDLSQSTLDGRVRERELKNGLPARSRASDLVNGRSRRLSTATLPLLSQSVFAPSYDRTALSPGVVHLGSGSFHRAHQAVYFHRLAELGHRGWGVVGSGLRTRRLHSALSAQDCLYTVLARGSSRVSAEVVGVMLRHLHAPRTPEWLLHALTDPRIRLVTLTVTAHGYCDDPEGVDDDGVASAIEVFDHDAQPETAFDFLAEALRRRRELNIPPFTVMSCDNITDNGRATRHCVVDRAQLVDPELARWIDRSVAFPSTMVDRITPPTSKEDRRWLTDLIGLEDEIPVVTEEFSQWVVEDSFCNERPPLEDVGVQYVSDVRPHKTLKMRLLNGGHCALGYLGTLAGHSTSAAAMGDPTVHAAMRRLLTVEIGPLLPSVDGVHVDDYCESVMTRMANPHIVDPLSRLTARGSTRMPSYLLPSLIEAVEEGTPADILVLIVAAWMHLLRGTSINGREINLDDPNAGRLTAAARRGLTDPRRLLELTEIFGELRSHAVFVERLHRTLVELDRHGFRKCLTDRLAVLT